MASTSSSINVVSSVLDVQSIVDGLINVEREPVRRLQTATTTLQNKVKAFQNLNTKLSGLLNKANDILFKGEVIPFQTPYTFEDRLPHSIFALRKATSSDESILGATSAKGLASGTYAITISSLAKGKAMASANFADTTTTKTGTGTLVITTGTNDPVTVTIDAANNTLDGVRRAINAANAGVTATIVNDGSGTPYRLLISANDTGTANAFTVTDNLTGGQALGLAQSVAAADATLNINGIAVTKSSNTVTDVIDGVTLNLKATTASAVTVTADKDIDGMVSALKDLVSAYNEVNSLVNAQFKYDSTTKTAGVLSGDPTLRSTQFRVQSILTQSIVNTFTDFRVISQVGFDFNNDGSITLNETELRDKLSSDFTGVAALFLGDGTAEIPEGIGVSDNRVTYEGKTSATQNGTYNIQVTALAQQGSVTGGRTVSSLSQDETLTITYGGNPTTVNLLSGDSLSTVLTKINNALGANGVPATATNDGSDHLKISTNNYGGAESITVVSNRPNASGSTGIGTTPVTGTGTDIAGTINGDAAVGAGLTLTGAAGKPEEGLTLTIAQSTTGSYGSVTITPAVQGDEGASIMVNLRTALKNITDPLSGPIHSATDGLNTNIHDITDRISAYEDRLAVRKTLLTAEFSRADQALRLLSVSQASLSSQMASLAKIG